MKGSWASLYCSVCPFLLLKKVEREGRRTTEEKMSERLTPILCMLIEHLLCAVPDSGHKRRRSWDHLLTCSSWPHASPVGYKTPRQLGLSRPAPLPVGHISGKSFPEPLFPIFRKEQRRNNKINWKIRFKMAINTYLSIITLTIDKEDVVHVYNGILLSYKKE